MKSLSSIRYAAPLCLLAVVSAACQKGDDEEGSGGSGSNTAATTATTGQAAGGGDTGTGGSGTGGAGSGTGGSGGAGSGTGGDSSSSTGGSDPGQPGWTIVPLLDDETDPDSTTFRSGNDLVTGIHFESVDDGYVTTKGDEQTFGRGGAIFRATQSEITDILFSGVVEVPCLLGNVDFQGIDKSPDGFYARGIGCNVIASHDGGATFTAELSSAGDQFGLNRVFAYRTRDNETLAVLDRFISKTDTAPGPNALWDDLWAPEAIPTIPDPLPEDQCHSAPSLGATPLTAHAYASLDGSLIAYTGNEENGAAVCVSTDAGRSFFPKYVPDLGEDAVGFSPDGVLFASDSVGITWWANYIYPGQQYLGRTTDGGETWEQVALPDGVGGTAEIELRGGFFAPDGEHGWLVGYDWDHDTALIIRTSDAGATWERTGGDLAAKVSTAGGNKLHAGFALDATHIWVGGEYGIFASNSAGGD